MWERFNKLVILIFFNLPIGQSCTRWSSNARKTPETSSLVLAIGGIEYRNSSHEVGGVTVDIIGDFGVCSKIQLALPFPLCHHRAVRLGSRGSVLVCGSKVCTHDPSAPNLGPDNHVCLVWQRGSRNFEPLHAMKSNLPGCQGANQPGLFDLVGLGDEELMFRANGGSSVWKGLVDQDFSLFWRPVTPLPFPLAGVCSLEHNGKMYVMGGYHERMGNGSTISSHLMRYIESPEGKPVGWQHLQPMPSSKAFMSCVSTDQGIIALGGTWGVNDEVVNSAWLWDPNQDLWMEHGRVSNMNLELEASLGKYRLYAHDRLLLFGGEEAKKFRQTHQSHFSNRIQSWSPQVKDWNTLEYVLSEPRSEIAAVEIPGSWIPECSSV